MKLVLLTGSGFLCLLLGGIGLLLPLWPTTPFVLLAGLCFSRTPRLQAHILALPFFKEYFESRRSCTRLPRKTLLVSLLFLWTMLLLSAFFLHTLWLYCLLALIGLAVSAHLFWMALARANT